MSSWLIFLVVFGVVLILLVAWHFYCRVCIPKIAIAGLKILITGGSEGIGFSMAKACVLNGGSVALLARNQQKLEKAASELSKLRTQPDTQQVLVIACDVADADAMQHAIDNALTAAKWTDLDCLVCNAGVELVASLENTSMADYRRLMDINYFGVVHAIKTCLPRLKANKVSEHRYGRILITSSLFGVMSMAYYSAYCASKWALRGFVEAIYAEMAALNIYTSIVYPPDVKTTQYQREKQADIPTSVKQLSDAADVFDPDDVGRDMMRMLEKGQYHRSWGMDGWMLLNLTTGFSVPWHLGDTLTQIFGLGLLRMIGMWYIQNMYNVCKTSLADRGSGEKPISKTADGKKQQ